MLEKIVVLILLASLFSQSSLMIFANIHSHQLRSTHEISISKNSSFVHLHIPKTGGISIESFLLQHFPNKFIFTFTHNYTIEDFPENICLVVVRDPRDRFISVYKYWRYGSNLYFRGNSSDLSLTLNITGYEEWKSPITSIFDFMNAAGNISHPFHSYVLHRLNASQEGRGMDDAQTWGVHFQPQSNWLKGANRRNVVLLRYSTSSDTFSKRFFRALRYLALNPPNNTKLEPINTSLIKSHSRKTLETISSNSNSSKVIKAMKTTNSSKSTKTTTKKIKSTNSSKTTKKTNKDQPPLDFDDNWLLPQYRHDLKKIMRNYSWFNKFYAEDLALWTHISNYPETGKKLKTKQWKAVF